jgi:hypothetical protein
MGTSFLIEPGYIFTHSQEISRAQLQEIAKSISQEALYAKCVEYGLKEDLPCSCKLSELIARYKEIPTEDGFCTFEEDGIDQDAFSGNGPEHRMVREQMCRAFGILVLDECYKRGYSVSFIIH